MSFSCHMYEDNEVLDAWFLFLKVVTVYIPKIK